MELHPGAGDGRLPVNGVVQQQVGVTPPAEYKRRKTGVQLLAERRAASSTARTRVICYGSMKKVCQFFASFNGEKAALVEEIGFGGPLSWPWDAEPDPRFSLWLMRSVETSDRPGLCIHTRNVHGMICRDVDVHFMFGVPFEGDEIVLGGHVSEKIVRAVRKILQISNCSYPITMSEVQEVMVKRYDRRMSNAQRASFKVAAVIFAVSNFLATNSCSTEYANTEILKHLLDPDNIMNVNWAGYFIKCVKREAARLKDEQLGVAPSTVIYGCPAILQV